MIKKTDQQDFSGRVWLDTRLHKAKKNDQLDN